MAAPFLFLVPGLVVLALLRREDREALLPDEGLFLAVAVSVMASAWVALVLAEAGRFSLVAAAALLAAASVAAVVLFRRRLGLPVRRPRAWSDILPAAAVLALALALQARPSEYVVGGRDPGAYVAAMATIARTGGIVVTDPVVLSIPPDDVELFYRNRERPDFSWSRFMGFDLERPASGRVFPQFFHLFPAFGAYLFQALGTRGALATPPVFGVLGTMAVFFAVRRLFGRVPALLTGILLGLNVVQVWFGRYPVSETMSQFLLFTAMLLILLWEEFRSDAFGVLAGVSLGLSLLVRIDSALVAVPLLLYVLVRRVRGDLLWGEAAPLVAGFGVLGLHAGLHAAFWARKYAVDIITRRYWQQPAAVWALAAVGVVAAMLLAHRFGLRARPLLERHGPRARSAAMAALAVLAAYAYWLRPMLSAWAGADGNDKARALPDPGVLLALGFRHLAAHDAQSLVRLGWFVTPLGLVLGILGLMAVLARWRPRYLFPVLLGLTVSLFYLYKVRVWNDYPFALRRFVPVTLPLLLAFAAFLLARLAARGGPRRVAAAALALGLAALYARDTARIVRYVDWRGSVRFVADVARRFGPDDVVVFEQPRSIHLLSLPLWAAHGVNALELARFNPDPDRLRHLVGAWRGRWRNIYFVHTYRTDLCGLFLERVETKDFGTFEWYGYDHRPSVPEFRSLHFTVSRVVPPEELRVPSLEEVDVGGTDDVQVSGFFDKEGGEGRTFRWTGACASVYLPAARPGAALSIVVSSERRPAATPASVSVSLSGQSLGRFIAGPTWTEQVFALPSPLPAGPPVLRLDVPPWRPINFDPASTDTRDLGVMVDRIRVVPAKIAVSTRGGGGP
jgi:dolichyl-phosphate-mannose-protein mannosyltransferase